MKKRNTNSEVQTTGEPTMETPVESRVECHAEIDSEPADKPVKAKKVKAPKEVRTGPMRKVAFEANLHAGTLTPVEWQGEVLTRYCGTVLGRFLYGIAAQHYASEGTDVTTGDAMISVKVLRS
jgi:hypothetical protein